MKWSKKFITTVVILALLLVGLSVFVEPSSAGSMSKRIRFIGLILDRAEQFEMGTYTVVVKIFDAEADGVPLFTENHTIVLQKYDRGIFTIEIGSVQPLELDFNTHYYLAVTLIDAGGYTAGELIPRYPMNASPYSLNSERLDGLDSSQLVRSDEDDSISGNITIMGDLVVTGTASEINSGDIAETGVNATTFTIDTDDPNGAVGDTNNFLPFTIALGFGETNDQRLEFNLNDEQFMLTDDISVTGDLSVTGFAILDGGIDVNDSQFRVSAEGNTYTAGEISAMNDTQFGGRVYLGTDGNDTISVNAEITGNMPFGGTTYIRTKSGDLTLNPFDDVYLGLDPDDDTVLPGDLTVPKDRLYGSTTKVLEFIDDDLTVYGNIYVQGSRWFFALPDNGIDFANGDFIRASPEGGFDFNVSLSNSGNLLSAGTGVAYLPNTALRVGSADPSNFGDDSGDLWVGDDLAIKGDLSMTSNLTVASIASFQDGILIPEDMAVIGALFTDTINTPTGYNLLSIDENTYMSRNVTMSGGPFFFDNFDTLMNPVGQGRGVIQLGRIAQRDQIIIGQDLTVQRNLSVAGQVVANLEGTTMDSYSIDSDESSNTPRFAFKDTSIDGDEYLEFNRAERVFHLSDNVSFSNELTIQETVFVIGSGLSHFVDSGVHIGANLTDATISGDSGDLFVQGDVELGGSLSVNRDLSLAGVVFGDNGITIMGDLTALGTMFVDTILDETGTITFGDNTQTIEIISSDWILSTTGDLEEIGSLTADGLLTITNEGNALFVSGGTYIGYNNAAAQHRLRGTTYFGAVDTLEINDSGDLVVTGDTVSFGDDPADTFQATSQGLNVASNGTISDADSSVIINDTALYTYGDLTAGGGLLVFGPGESWIRNGSLAIGNKVPTTFGSTPGSLFATGDLQMDVDVSVGGDITMNGIWMSNGAGLQFNCDVTVADTLFIDVIKTYQNEFSTVLADAMLDNDVTVATGHIYTNTNMFVNPDRFGPGRLILGGFGQGDIIEVAGSMSISESLTIEDVIYGTWDLAGTAYRSFTIDMRDKSDTPTLYFFDPDGHEYLRWNDRRQNLEFSDDITVTGGLTAYGDLIVEGGPLNVSRFNGPDHTVMVPDGRMLVNASSGIQATPTAGFGGDGDLFIEGDFEIFGDLSFGGDTTIAGLVFSDDYTAVMGPLTVTGDVDVRGQMLDGVGPALDVKGDLSVSQTLSVLGSDLIFIGMGGAQKNYLYFSDSSGRFGWNGIRNEFEISDLSLGGDLTVYGSTYLGDTNTDTFIVRSSGLNVQENGFVWNASRMFEIDDSATLSGELSVPEELYVHGSGTSQFTGTDATVRTEDGHLAIRSSSETISPSAASQDDGDLFVEDDVEVGRSVSVAGNAASLTATYIGTNARTGTAVIRSAGLNIDQAGRLYDRDSQFMVSDDALVTGELSVNDTLKVHGQGLSQFSGGHVQVGPGTHVGIADDDNDLYVAGDVEVGGDISINGDTTIAGVVFGDDYTMIDGNLSVTGDLDIRGDLYNGSPGVDTVQVKYSLSESGNLTVATGVVHLGTDSEIRFADNTEQVYFDAGANELYFSDDVNIEGELTLPNGSIPGIGNTRITLGLVDQDQIDITGDVLVAQALTVGATLHIGNAPQAVAYNVIDSDGIFNPSLMMNNASDLYVAGDVEVGGNVSMGGDTTIVGVIFSDDGTIIMDDLTVRGGLFVDRIDDELGRGLSFRTDTTFGQDLTTTNGRIFSLDQLLINPDQTGPGSVQLGQYAQDDEIYLNGNVTVLGALTMTGTSLSVSGAITGRTAATGTPKPSFTIDTDGSSSIPSLVFEDSNGDEYLRWNKNKKVIEFSDDTTVDGGLTSYGDMIVNGGPLNAHYFSGADTTLEVSDGRVAVFADSGITGSPSAGFNDDGDLFVEGETEIIGDLSVGGDTTIAGVVFADDYTLVQGDLTVTRDIYAGRDMFITGEVKGKGLGENEITGYMHVGNITTGGGTAIGSLAIGEDLTVVGGNIESPTAPLKLNAAGGLAQPVLIGTQNVGGISTGSGDMYVVGDIEVGQDMSLAGNLTMIGIIYSSQYILIGGNLSITDNLDLRGNLLDGLSGSLDFTDDISITGGLSMTDNLRVGRTGTGTFAVGGSRIRPYNIIANDLEVPNGSGVGSDNDLYVSGGVEVDGTFDIDGTGLNDLEGLMNIGSIDAGEGGSEPGALAISHALTVVGNNIDAYLTPLQLNAAGGSDQAVLIGATTHEGIADEGGDLYVAGDVEIKGDLSIGGDTTIAGVIFGDDYTQITGSLTVDQHLDLRSYLFNGLGNTVTIADDLSLTGDMTVRDELYVLGADVSRILNGSLKIGNKSPSLASGAEDLYISGDMEIWGDLSIGGDTTIAGVIFSDDATEIIGELTTHGNVYPSSDDAYDLGSVTAEWRNLYIDGVANIDSLIADTADINAGTIDNTIFGNNAPARATFTDLSVTGHTELGNANTDNILFNADIISNIVPNADNSISLGIVGQQWRDVYLAADGDIKWGAKAFTFDGVNFSANDDLSIEGVLNVDGTGASVIDGYLNIASTGGQNAGDAALGGDLTVEDAARIGADGTGTVAIGGAPTRNYNIIGDFATVPGNASVSGDNDVLIEGTVEIDEQIDVDGFGLNDLEGYLNLGAINAGEGGSARGALAISEDLTILGGNIDTPTQALILNAGKGLARPVFIGATSHSGIAEGSGDLFVADDIEVAGDLSIGGSTTIAGVVFGDDFTQIMGDLTVVRDIYAGRNTIITGELDVNGFGVNTIAGTIETGAVGTNGGSGPGAVAIGEDLTVVGGNIDTPTQALQLNAGKGNARPVFIGATSHTGIADAGGDLFVANDVEIGGRLSIGGDTTINGVLFAGENVEIMNTLIVGGPIDVRGFIFDSQAEDVDIADNLSIAGDLTVFGNTKLGNNVVDGFNVVSSGLNVDRQGALSDRDSSMIVNDDLLVNDNMLVNDTVHVNAAGLSQFVDGRVQIGPGTHAGLGDDNSDMYIVGDLALGGDLSISEDATVGRLMFSEEYLHVGVSLTIEGSLDVRADIRDGLEADVDVKDNLLVDGDLTVTGSTKLGDATNDGFQIMSSGMNIGHDGSLRDANSSIVIPEDVPLLGELSVNNTLTVHGPGLSQFIDGHVQIGAGTYSGIADDDGDLYVVGDVEIRQDLSIGGDTAIAGVIFGDDYTEITGALSVTDNLDLGGYLYDSGDGVIEILGDLFLSGNATIAGVIFGDDYTEIKGSLTATGDLDVRGTIFDGAGDIIELADNVSVAGDLSVADQILITVMPGTASPEFALDVDDHGVVPTFLFTDATENETLRWNDNPGLQTFELSDDLSLLGALTISGNRLVVNNGMYLQNTVNNTLEIYETDTLLSGDVTIGGDLTVLGARVRMQDMSLYIGDASLVTEATDTGSILVGKDLTVQGILYAQKFSATAVTLEGTHTQSFTIHKLSNVLDQDLSLAFSDDGDNGAHYLIWNDGSDLFEFSNDVSINGALTTRDTLNVSNGNLRLLHSFAIGNVSKAGETYSPSGGDLFVENDVEIDGSLLLNEDLTLGGVIFGQDFLYIKNNLTVSGDVDVRTHIFDGTASPLDVLDEVSVSGALNVYGARIYGRNNEYIDMGAIIPDTISIQGDLVTPTDMTIAGNLSVAGAIKTFDELYVNISGDTMTGRLIVGVGGEGNLALDVDGNIEYTGTLKNQSPVKFEDGIEIVNLGGISGGQQTNKDVMIFVEGDILTYENGRGREVAVPDLQFIRYVKYAPETRKGKGKVTIKGDTIYLRLTPDEHLVAVNVKHDPYLVNNVGLDGTLMAPGDFKITGHNKITLFAQPEAQGHQATIRYTYRKDISTDRHIRHYIEQDTYALNAGWNVVYVEEIPLSVISEHDTSAMSMKTMLAVKVVPLQEYEYSADTYVIAVISDNGTVTQYH